MAVAVLLAATCLSSCAVYLHDDGLEASATAAAKSVDNADVSGDVTATLKSAADLAKKEEAAVVAFWISQRNRELINLLQPDPLERRYFTTERKYSGLPGSYTRDPAVLHADIKQTVDCRLDELLANGEMFAGCMVTEHGIVPPASRSEDDYTKLRNVSFSELQFSQSQIEAARGSVETAQQNLANEFKKHPGSIWEKNYDFSCDSLGKIDTGKLAADPATSGDDVALAAVEYGIMCQSLATNLAGSRANIPGLGRGNKGLIQQNRDALDKLITEEESREKLIVQLQAEARKIQTATSGPGPAQKDLEVAVSTFHDLLTQADGAAKLSGLLQLQTLLDQLTGIELDKASADATKGSVGAGDATTERGVALLKLADATAAAVDAFRNAVPAEKAQSLVIAAIAVQQQISVAKIEADLDQTKIRLRTGLDRLYTNEVHALSQAGLVLSESVIHPNANHDAVVYLAAAWDSCRIPAALLPYREMEAEREASIEISAVNAADTQKVIAAATAAITAYAKGGITQAEVADTLSKFFIGGAILK